MACTCIENFNRGLAEMNAMVDTSLVLSGIGSDDERKSVRVKVGAIKVNRSRKPVPTLIAKFCPFCGSKYEN